MKVFAILAFIAVAFLLVAGCTEEKPAPEAASYVGLTYDCSSGVCYYRYLTSNPIPPTLTPTPTPTPVPTPEYVMCSDYVKIVDKYKTVNSYIIITSDNRTNGISAYQYPNVSVGKYFKTDERECGSDNICTVRELNWRWSDDPRDGFVSWNRDTPLYDSVIPVTEAESGYREACKVVRR